MNTFKHELGTYGLLSTHCIILKNDNHEFNASILQKFR